MKLQVYRTSASSYLSSHFLNKEQKALEEIEGIKYLKSIKEYSPEAPLALITNTHTKPEEISDNILAKTILMIHPNSGRDNFTKDFVANNSFPIICGNPIRTNAVCEYILSALFHHYTKIPDHGHWDEERKWKRSLLRDQKAIIIGNGHIGKQVYQSLKLLCRDVVIYDPYDSSSYVTKDYGDDLFEGKNILIIAASLTQTSRHLVTADQLNLLDAKNIIINPARGGIIKEDDLKRYLHKNPKSFAYLDVFEDEPFPPGSFNDLSNLNKTSHIAGVSERISNDIISFEYIIIKEFLKLQAEQFQSEYTDCILTTKDFFHEQ